MGRRVAFVPPRFGDTVVGGSEAVMREMALALGRRNWEVEVITTCATNHYTWDNDLPAGVDREEGVTVRRFPTVAQASKVGVLAQFEIQYGRKPSLDEQLTWIGARFTVPKLYEHLLRYGDQYDAVIFSPYLFWTATACLSPVADRAVVMPCLHDESYARLDVVRPVLADPARVWFLSEPEHQLAHRLGPVADRHAVVGAGVHVPDSYDPDGFRKRHRLHRPFILYAGRREQDKGWGTLLDFFGTAVTDYDVDVDLVTLGVGPAVAPAELAHHVRDLGFLPDRERDNAFAAALAYVQPSRMESFSRTIMEAWLAGTPVLTVSGSPVVEWHCERSGGGLRFSTAKGVVDALQMLLADPDRGAEMARRGRDYVLAHYQWPTVLDRIEEDLKSLC